MQITDGTLKVLKDQHGELKDHLLMIPAEKLLEPSVNICAGVRWLYEKKRLANHRLHREVNWIEAVAEYKGVLTGFLSESKKYKESKIAMKNFLDYYRELTGN